tara:strand:- start:28 stop:504 length:477 start_codon:yes stop_codon:yes gene_type:complete
MASTYNKKQLAELTAFAKGEEAQSCKAEKLNGAGFRFEDFRKSHEDCNADNFAVCREAVIAGMPAAKRNLLVTPASELPVHMRADRRQAQMAVGAYMGRAYKMLKKLQTEAAGEDATVTELDKIRQLVIGLVKRAGKDNSGVSKKALDSMNATLKLLG